MLAFQTISVSVNRTNAFFFPVTTPEIIGLYVTYSALKINLAYLKQNVYICSLFQITVRSFCYRCFTDIICVYFGVFGLENVREIV